MVGMCPRGLGVVIGGGRNGGNVSIGGLGMVNSNGITVNGSGGMVSGGACGSCFNARWLRTTGITPSKLSIFHCGLADLCCCGAKEEELHGI